MLFIGTQAVLVEVKTNKEEYLIGDQLFSTLPTKILKRILSSANWNRALRYLAPTKPAFSSLGFFLIRFELYLHEGKIICLSKNFFEQKILDQTLFQNSFLQDIFNFRGRNFQLFLPKSLPQISDLEIINQISPELNLNRCWVSDHFQFQKHKFKILFRSAPSFKMEITPNNQIIYYSNFHFSQVDLFDTKTGIFYEQGRYFLNVEACLTFSFEDQVQKQAFLAKIVTDIKTTPQISEAHKNWHLFNVTGNLSYLVQELHQLVKKLSFVELLVYLEAQFKEIQVNYNSLIFSTPQLKKIFLEYNLTDEEKAHLKGLFVRYGVLNNQDFAALKTK